ncbi:sensor histidine kinase [Marinobacterium sp. YM272]|uniref:sensor histidine kinase n=1 Tax=Marinobacterium sp. YM272 TaxID=3421654 RepID=UPI003D7FED6A
MKWHRKLFLKIFLIIWLVSAAGTAVAVISVLAVAAERQYKELLETRALGQARLMLEREDWAERRRHDDDHDHDGHRRPPLRVWIFDPQSDRLLLGPDSDPPRGPEAVSFDMEGLNGEPLKVIANAPRRELYLKKILRFMVSIQAVIVLFVSALAALLLSWLIVRPINQLRAHAKDLYRNQNLSTRASTRLSQRQDEIGELSREFNAMAGYVEDTLTSQQRLLQDVSHELRAPLARLQVAAGLAEQKLGEEDPTARRINRECEQLDGLIGKILSLSRLDQASREGEPFPLAELLEELRADVAFTQPERPFRLSVEPPALRLSLNEELLRGALANLISNALKYTEADSLLTLKAARETDGVRFTLRDRGPGVDDALLARITDPFVRGRGGSDGYGLGLSIARRAIERLGGRLSLRNHPDGGLECVIQLPLSSLSA